MRRYYACDITLFAKKSSNKLEYLSGIFFHHSIFLLAIFNIPTFNIPTFNIPIPIGVNQSQLIRPRKSKRDSASQSIPS